MIIYMILAACHLLFPTPFKNASNSVQSNQIRFNAIPEQLSINFLYLSDNCTTNLHLTHFNFPRLSTLNLQIIFTHSAPIRQTNVIPCKTWGKERSTHHPVTMTMAAPLKDVGNLLFEVWCLAFSYQITRLRSRSYRLGIILLAWDHLVTVSMAAPMNALIAYKNNAFVSISNFVHIFQDLGNDVPPQHIVYHVIWS